MGLKKQSQFPKEKNWRKVLHERILWQYLCHQGTKKQSQFIRSEYCVLRIAKQS
jgi:hypothetical protein